MQCSLGGLAFSVYKGGKELWGCRVSGWVVVLIYTKKSKKDMPRFFFPLRNMIFKQIRILVTAEEPILFSSKESHEPNEY